MVSFDRPFDPAGHDIFAKDDAQDDEVGCAGWPRNMHELAFGLRIIAIAREGNSETKCQSLFRRE